MVDLLGKLKPLRMLSQIGIFGLSAIFVSTIYANPVVDNVAQGNVTIQQVPNSTVVNQTSAKAIINWKSFNINPSEKTHFQQPAGGVALNRISPTNGASQIYGQLTATGQIILVNPAGIFFGPSAYVNVGGLIATTANISDHNFMNGIYQFSKVDSHSGAIINEGQIIAAQNGLVALVAPTVINRGMIQANLGRVVLASGSAFTMSFSEDKLVNFVIDAPGTQVANTGSVIADGGKILVAAKTASGVLDRTINMEGLLQAKSMELKDGEIVISGDPGAGEIRIAATVDASGKRIDEKGGKVEITGYNILLDSPALLDVSGDKGAGVIQIGGNYQGIGPLPHANAVVMAPGAKIYADALTSGDGGQVILWSDSVTKVHGSLSARGGSQSGNGGLIETSSKGFLATSGIQVDTSALHGEAGAWLLDPADLTISTAATANPAPFTATYTADNNSNTSTVNTTDLTNALAAGSVIIQTTAGGTGTGSGNITVSDPFSWSSSNSLTLSSINNIFINAAVGTGAAGSQLILDMAGSGGTQTGIISGSGTLVKQGAGTFTTSLANTYTGGTTVNAGTLSVTNANGLGSSGAITVNAGTLHVSGVTLANNSAMTINGSGGGSGALSGTTARVNNPITLGSASTLRNPTGGSTLFIGGNINTAGFPLSFTTAGNIIVDNTSAISGTGSVTVTGNGTVRFFGGTNTYTGGTTVNGLLQIDGLSSLGPSGAITIANGASLAFGINGTLLNTSNITVSGTGNIGGAIIGGGDAILNNNIIMVGNTTFAGSFVAGGSLTLNGSISGAFNVTVSTIRPVTFGGSNTYSGTTSVSGNTLTLTSIGALGNTTSTTIASGATLNINFNNATLSNGSGISLTGTGVSSVGALTFSGTNATLANAITLSGATSMGGSGSGVLSGNILGAQTLTKVGSGTISLAGTSNASTTTTISAGTLQIGNGSTTGTLGTGAVTNNGTLALNRSNSYTLTNDISGTGSLTQSGTGTTILTGTNTYSGITTISGGTLQVGNVGITGSLGTGNITNNAALVFNRSNSLTISNDISGSGTLTQLGAGTTILTGTNIYSGITTISSGTLQVGNGGATGTLGSGDITNNSLLAINRTGSLCIWWAVQDYRKRNMI